MNGNNPGQATHSYKSRRRHGVFKITAAVSLCAALLGTYSTASAQSILGALTGLIRDPKNIPVAGATVTALQQDGHMVRGTVSNSEGVYSFSDLTPGTYSVISEVNGYPAVVAAATQVLAGRAARADVTMNPPGALVATPAAISSAAQPASIPSARGNLGLLASLAPGSPTGSAFPARAANLDPSIPFPNPVPVQTPPAQPPPTEKAPVSKGADVPAPTDMSTPFADYDATWLNGNSRQKDAPLDTKYFSPEFRADTFFGLDFNQPKDHSMGGSSEVFRNGEVQLEDLSIGGDFHVDNVRGRVLALFGLFAATTVRNDASAAVGQWDVRSAYKYVSEAYGGYHFNVNHGLNVDAGIFVSYVGLFSYHNFDNWAYQPSYVSSNTPWFFNGVRVQWFPTHHLKIEPWIINGWQSYNKFNGHPGLGGQIKWTPKDWLTVLGNQYGVGNDNIGIPHRGRYHTDDSIEVKYYDKPQAGNGIDRMAFTFTGDAGCETGGGVTCHGGKGGPKQAFLGYMAYNRIWWHKDLFAVTLGGGQISNPGRYLALVLPINGADAISGTPYFPATPGSSFKAYDATATFDYMPKQYFTFRTEIGYRHTNVPYWSGRGGITPPGGNNGSPADFVCSTGASSGQTDLTAAEAACGGGRASVWFPDLRQGQALLSFSLLVKF